MSCCSESLHNLDKGLQNNRRAITQITAKIAFLRAMLLFGRTLWRPRSQATERVAQVGSPAPGSWWPPRRLLAFRQE